MLRPLLDIVNDSERFGALAADAAAQGRTEAHFSSAIRPYLLAALLDAEAALAERPALVVTADDRSARDLARDLRAYPASRPVRYYPSRGTGYESHVAPPPHLVGLRIAALDALTGPGEADRIEPPLVVASAIALAEAVPDASLRPAGFALHRGEEVDLGDVAELLVECGYERLDQVEERGQFALRGGILDVYPATEERAVRLELFGDEIESLRWFSTFTQRSLGEAARVEISPAAELAAEHRELAEAATDQEDRPDITELLPVDRFQAPLELVPDDTAVVIAAADEIPAALKDHWNDVTTAMHDADARHLYVEVADPLRERALLEVSAQAADQPHSFRAQRPASAARTPAEAEGELSKQLRSGYATVVAFDRRGEAERARYSFDRLTATLLEDRAPEPGSLAFAEGSLSEGFISPELKLAVIPWRQLLHRRKTAASAPARGRLRSLLRAARRRPRRPRGPRHRPLRRLRDEDPRRRHPRLPPARVPRRGPRLRPSGPAGQDQPLHRRRRRGPAALGARRLALGADEGPSPPRRRRARGRPAQPLRGAPRSPRPRLRARRRVRDPAARVVPLPGDRRPARRDRGGRARHGGGDADGPADLRGRRLRQDRGCDAGRA